MSTFRGLLFVVTASGCAFQTVAPTNMPDCASTCEPFRQCAPDQPDVFSECLTSCNTGDADPEARRAIGGLSCPQVDALLASRGERAPAPPATPETAPAPEPEPRQEAQASRGSGNGTYSFHHEVTTTRVGDRQERSERFEEHGARPRSGAGRMPRVRIEVAQVIVAPTRADGTGWDGQRPLDDDAAGELEDALRGRDAAARATSVLASPAFASFDPPDLNGRVWLVSNRETVAETTLQPARDGFVTSATAALGPSRLVGGDELHLALWDRDARRDDAIGEVTLDRASLIAALGAGVELPVAVRDQGAGSVLFVVLRVTED